MWSLVVVVLTVLHQPHVQPLTLFVYCPVHPFHLTYCLRMPHSCKYVLYAPLLTQSIEARCSSTYREKLSTVVAQYLSRRSESDKALLYNSVYDFRCCLLQLYGSYQETRSIIQNIEPATTGYIDLPELVWLLSLPPPIVPLLLLFLHESALLQVLVYSGVTHIDLVFALHVRCNLLSPPSEAFPHIIYR